MYNVKLGIANDCLGFSNVTIGSLKENVVSSRINVKNFIITLKVERHVKKQ